MTEIGKRPELLAGLTELEEDVDKLGWDCPPFLLAVFEQKAGGPGQSVLLCSDVPGFEHAMRRTRHPVDATASLVRGLRLAKALQAPGPPRPPRLLGVVLITEMWRADVSLPGVTDLDQLSPEQLATLESIRASQMPDRTEWRLLHLACVDGSVAVLMRKRGDRAFWLSNPDEYTGELSTTLLELVAELKDLPEQAEEAGNEDVSAKREETSTMAEGGLNTDGAGSLGESGTVDQAMAGGSATFSAYQAAVAAHGVRSYQAREAVQAALNDGWNMEGLSQAIQANGTGGNWPSGGDQRGR